MAPASRAACAVLSVQASATDEDVDELGGVVLLPNGLDEIGDDRLLVMRGDEEGVRMLFFCLGDLHLAAKEPDEEEHDLVQEAQAKDDTHDGVEGDDRGQNASLDAKYNAFKCTPPNAQTKKLKECSEGAGPPCAPRAQGGPAPLEFTSGSTRAGRGLILQQAELRDDRAAGIRAAERTVVQLVQGGGQIPRQLIAAAYGLPVTGCSNWTLQECRNCRSRSRFMRSLPLPYRGSPTRGWWMWRMCTRI